MEKEMNNKLENEVVAGSEPRFVPTKKLSKKDADKYLMDQLGKEKILYLKSLGEKGLSNLIDNLIENTSDSDPYHENWGYIGGALDYAKNEGYSWVIDYQIKASKRCYAKSSAEKRNEKSTKPKYTVSREDID